MRDGEVPVDPMTNHSSIYGVCTNERQYTRGISFVPPIVRLTGYNLDMERHSALPTARCDEPSFSGNFFVGRYRWLVARYYACDF